MSHKAIGTATINHLVTSIRKYDHGSHTVEINGEVRYHTQSLQELEEKLAADGVKYTITDRT